MITKAMLIEDLVHELPDSVTYLMKRGIKCLACGEPIWGTLESSAKEKGFSIQDIDIFVSKLNELKESQNSFNE